MKRAQKIVLVFLAFWFCPLHSSVFSDPVWGKRILLHQPDGTVFQGFIYGDEFHKRIETAEGFTIVLNERTGEIEYAVLQNNRLQPSGLVVGRILPSILEEKGFPKHLSDRLQRIGEIRHRNPAVFHDLERRSSDLSFKVQNLTGTKKVFAVCVEFLPETDPPTKWSTGLYPPPNFGDRLFNDDPSVYSMANFFKAQSHNQFWPEGSVFSVWVTLPHTASYYKENGSWVTILSHTMDAIKTMDPGFDFTLYADDGQMDAILIWAGTVQTWGTFYWPHMSQTGLNKYGVAVRFYNAINERFMDGSENKKIDTFCHEYGHMTGLPDLYDYSDFFNRPLGYYCLMGFSDSRIGFCGYIKSEKYGWVEAEEIGASGNYSIDALGLASASNPRIYKIYIDYPSEYLLLENRMNGSHPEFENFPDRRSGLLISHVDENYPPAACLPAYPFYGVEAICPALDPTITSLVSYAGYWDEMVWAAEYGYSQLGPSYPDDRPAGSSLTLSGSGDTENVIFRNTRGHFVDTGIHINNIGSVGNTMNFVLSNTSFTLILSAGDGGTTDPPPGTYSYSPGRQVTVTAVEDIYHCFSGWTGDLSETSNNLMSVTLMMDADRSLTAHFKKIHPPLDFQGKKVLNRSLSQAEYINILNWKSNPLNEGLPLDKFRLYLYSHGRWEFFRDFDTKTFEFQQRFVDKDTSYSYALVSVDKRGREGEPNYVVVH